MVRVAPFSTAVFAVTPDHEWSTRCERSNVKRFRGGLVFEAHRLLYHSTLGLRVIKKKKKKKKHPARTVHVFLAWACITAPAAVSRIWHI